MDSTKRKLLIIAPDFPPSHGGVERFVKSLADGLPKTDFDIRVLAGTRLAKSIRSIVIEKTEDYSVIRIPTISIKGLDFPRSIYYYKLIWQQLKTSDLVHLNDIRCFFISTILGRVLFQYNIVLTTLGFIFHTQRFLFFKKLYTAFFIISFRLFDFKVIASGLTDAAFCKKRKIRYQLIDMGIPISKWAQVERTPQKNHFLYFGRIDKNKNLASLIQSLSVYAKRGNPFDLKICGSAPPKKQEELLREIDNLGLNKNIHLMGNVDEKELMKYMGDSEFVLIPSLFESFGYTLIESLAAGCHVIAQNNEQFSHMLLGNDSVARLINFNKFDELSKAITELRLNYDPKNIAGIHFASAYDENQVIEKYIKVYYETNGNVK